VSRTIFHALAVATFAVVLTPGNLFGVSVAVGPTTCQPSLLHYSMIQTAINSVPAGATILVCPGVYPEQIVITSPLTLRGVTFNNSDAAVIVPPAGGLATNAVDKFGTPLASQLWVNNASGPVNISEIVVDGTGNGVTVCTPVIQGIFYENTGGTVNHVALRNQSGNGCGQAFLAEGGSASPTVTIENSSIHNTDSGIFSQNQVTLIAKGNDVDVSGSVNGVAITLNDGSTNTVSGNVVVTSYLGISPVRTATGTISANTITGGVYGIITSSDGTSITANNVLNSGVAGIYLANLTTSTAVVKTNKILNSNVGIEFNCFADPNVTGNTITEAQTGIDLVPVGLVVPNMFFAVQAHRAGC
jgi:parallel beta-helix repeat protein